MNIKTQNITKIGLALFVAICAFNIDLIGWVPPFAAFIILTIASYGAVFIGAKR